MRSELRSNTLHVHGHMLTVPRPMADLAPLSGHVWGTSWSEGPGHPGDKPKSPGICGGADQSRGHTPGLQANVKRRDSGEIFPEAACAALKAESANIGWRPC